MTLETGLVTQGSRSVPTGENSQSGIEFTVEKSLGKDWLVKRMRSECR